MVESNQTSCSYVCTVSYLGTKIAFGVDLASLGNMMGQTVPWWLMGLVLHVQGTESGTAEFMCLQGSKLVVAGPRLLSLAAFLSHSAFLCATSQPALTWPQEKLRQPPCPLLP